MGVIGVRSPHIIVIDEGDQDASKVELFIWNGNSEPSPNPVAYTLSKFIPATNNTETVYNISPYIAEYMKWDQYFDPLPDGTIQSANIKLWANVRVKRYKTISGVDTLLDSTDYYAVYGFSYYEYGYNYFNPLYFLENGTYYYHYDDDATVGYPGSIFAYLPSGYKVKYTDLETGTYIVTKTNSTSGIRQFIACIDDNWSVGNKVEVLNASNIVQKTFYFKPVTECYYTPITIDFINRFGVWQKTHMMKLSKTSLDVTSSEFNKMPSSYNYSNGTSNYDWATAETQRKVFNVIGTEKITVNTGWVDQSYNDTVLKQLMLSETIRIDNKPAKLNTKSIEYKTQINNKNINYTMEFEYAYNVISDVI